MKVKAIAFDAYGTLFDINTCVIQASEPLGLEGQAISTRWRQRQLEFTWLSSLMGKYEDFWSLTRAALQCALGELGVEIDESGLNALLEAYRTPGVFTDVMPMLDSTGGLPLVILSNGTPGMLQSAVRHNDLESRFQEIISVDRVKTYKPSPQVYALGPEALKLPAAEILFISSNWWDAWGAKTFGYTVCWCNRSGAKTQFPHFAPDFTVAGLDQVTPSILT
jgi:2-haloacid dehalogenase